MTSQHLERIKVFLASPSDVPEERLAVQSIIAEENRNHFHHAGYHLEIVGWETHSSPGRGQPHPQGRINPLIDDCELFVGVLWTRFGSPTGKAESGTEEEYNHALELLARPELPLCDIKIYFCDYPIKPSKIEPDQLKKVQEFKKNIEERGNILYWVVDDKDKFKTYFRQHIADWFQEYRKRGGEKRLSLQEGEARVEASEESLSPKFRSITKGF